MQNQSTFQKHVTAATVLNAAELITATIAKLAGNDISTKDAEAGCEVTDPRIVENALLKIKANLAHCVN